MEREWLLLVPGLSSPYDKRYTSLYSELAGEALRRGYDPCRVVCLPGQRDGEGRQVGILSLGVAKNVLEGELEVVEKIGGKGRIVAFSFGCSVALSIHSGGERKNIKTVLIGPIPLWQSWRAFRAGIGREHLGASTDIAPDKVFLDDLVPVEHLLCETQSAVIVAAGSEDEYCAPSYLAYLRSLASEQGLLNVNVVSIPGCRHTPNPSQSGWRNFIELALG